MVHSAPHGTFALLALGRGGGQALRTLGVAGSRTDVEALLQLPDLLEGRAWASSPAASPSQARVHGNPEEAPES